MREKTPSTVASWGYRCVKILTMALYFIFRPSFKNWTRC